jgi:predicted transcriptional regulator
MIRSALPGDFDRVASATDIPTSTVCRRLKALHEDGLIHVIDWQTRPNGGKPKPIYADGPGEDATYQVKSKAERAKERRIRKALEADAEPRGWVNVQARRRALEEADRTAKTRDPMIEALFGPARQSCASVDQS